MNVPRPTQSGLSWCRARVQTMNPAVDSTRLPAFRGCGSFHHLRGSLFCGVRAKCALADFGCDFFQRLWA